MNRLLLAVRIGAPVALKDIGMPAAGLDRAAKLVCEHPYSCQPASEADIKK
ncbi:MAG: hypothetical protein HY646_05370 [Acidobacteria bacterium]|nr:hypothetical protein [Acidobacteriota bacterium]